jgi:high affinity sulfate transporter 1
MSAANRFLPVWMRGYRPAWASVDVVAGLTLAAVAVPECMGYTSIAGTPIVTGLYTVIFPTVVFALLGSSKLLVVGADSATAAILAAGLAGLGAAGLAPNSSEWLAFASLTALVCGVMLLIARVLRLGFLGDFLSASVLIGFLTGVGIQVMGGQIPGMLGVSKGEGRWLAQQWDWIKAIPHASLPTVGFAVGTLVIIVAFKRFVPRVPGAIVAVVGFIAVSALTNAKAHGVAVVGTVQGGFPPVGLPHGISWGDALKVLGIAFSCCVLIIAQSAATSRSFAMRHGERVDVNRDIIGLSGANLAAGLTGTFVVNGSPTKTQILDEQKGRTQLANLTMSAAVLIVVLFATAALADMPNAVLAAIVFLIGVDLIDIAGMRRLWTRRRSEFLIASITCVVVFAIGVEQGILLAIVLSIVDLVRRQYSPRDFIIRPGEQGHVDYAEVVKGEESLPGLVVFRYDAELFYANASRFVDDVEAIIDSAPHPVRWLVLDAGTIDDVDYSAGVSLGGLLDYVASRDITFALVRLDDALSATLDQYELLDRIRPDRRFGTLEEALTTFHADSAAPDVVGAAGAAGAGPPVPPPRTP